MPDSSPEQVLSRIGWLGTQPARAREQLLAAAERRIYPPGSELYRLDDPPGGLFGIAAGFADVLAAPGPFQLRLVHIAGPGWWGGEAATISLSERRVDLRARTEVTALYIAKWKIEQLAAQDPGLWRNLASITVRHLDVAMLYAASFASPDLRLRLLTTLLRIMGPAMDLGGSLTLPLGQADLAELTGLSRNTISRLLAKLSQEGCVERQYGSLKVNVNRLRALVQNS